MAGPCHGATARLAVQVWFCSQTQHLLNADDEKASALKRRSAFKLLTELLLVGVYQDTAVIVNAVKTLASVDFVRDKDATQAAVSLLASFAKSGRQDVLGLASPMLSALSLEDSAEVTAVSRLAISLLPQLCLQQSLCLNTHVTCRQQTTQLQSPMQERPLLQQSRPIWKRHSYGSNCHLHSSRNCNRSY